MKKEDAMSSYVEELKQVLPEDMNSMVPQVNALYAISTGHTN
jgi:hypothetical protein